MLQQPRKLLLVAEPSDADDWDSYKTIDSTFDTNYKTNKIWDWNNEICKSEETKVTMGRKPKKNILFHCNQECSKNM